MSRMMAVGYLLPESYIPKHLSGGLCVAAWTDGLAPNLQLIRKKKG